MTSTCLEIGMEADSFVCLQLANVAVAAFLLLAPGNPRLFAAIYALADGPLAAALIVWQTAWVFSSSAHVISYAFHLAISSPTIATDI